jgi:AraC-like DNA-binding protein
LENLYYEITAFGICVTATLALLLAFIPFPKQAQLKAYRIARVGIVLALIQVSVTNLIEVECRPYPFTKHLMQLDTLIVSSFHVFLFMAAIVSMLNTRFYSLLKVINELVPTFVLSVIGVGIYLFGHSSAMTWYIRIFTVYYFYLIIKYSLLYQRVEKTTRLQLDNYYSEDAFRRLRWARLIFFLLMSSCIASGISVFLNVGFSVFFTVYYIVFYAFFTIQYLKYVHLFSEMGDGLVATGVVPVRNQHALSDPLPPEKNNHRSYEQLEAAIAEWENEKRYTQAGLTIEQVASQLLTNRTYLSYHMNVYRKETFKEWINRLRIEEAKVLLNDQPEIPVGQVGMLIGIPDKSNFGRQFSRITGTTPQNWRKQHK